MLKNNAITFKELTQKDKEIELYPSIQQEIQKLPSNVQHSKFLVMEPDDMKMAIMQLKTKNGHIVRQYYIDLEKLMKLYVLNDFFQSRYLKNSFYGLLYETEYTVVES